MTLSARFLESHSNEMSRIHADRAPVFDTTQSNSTVRTSAANIMCKLKGMPTDSFVYMNQWKSEML